VLLFLGCDDGELLDFALGGRQVLGHLTIPEFVTLGGFVVVNELHNMAGEVRANLNFGRQGAHAQVGEASGQEARGLVEGEFVEVLHLRLSVGEPRL